MILALGNRDDAERAASVVREHLARQGLLAYPTETVYGLGSAAEAGALARLAALKGREAGKPFLLLVSGRAMAERAGLVFAPAATAMAEAFWPGPLTLVLKGGEGKLPDALRGREGGIAVRHTSHQAVAGRRGAPRVRLSAAPPARPAGGGGRGPEQIVALFRRAYDAGELLVLDGGTLGNVPPSTIVDCTRGRAGLIREGALPRAEIRRLVGRLAP